MPLTEVRLEVGLPVWSYDLSGIVVEKRLLMPHGQNTVHVLYELKEWCRRRAARRLNRGSSPLARRVRRRRRSTERRPLERTRFGHELTIAELPPLQLMVDAARVEYTERQASWPDTALFDRGIARLHGQRRRAWTPGVFTLELAAGPPCRDHRVDGAVGGRDGARGRGGARRRARRAASSASTPPTPAPAHGLAAELVLAADQFIVTPVGRTAEAARVRARGDEERSVIAGYHWFTDWGRDTMISLEGLTLLTGRTAEAKGILRTFTSSHPRRPACRTCFPRAIATACTTRPTRRCGSSTRSIAISRRRAIVRCCMALLPQLVDVVEHHLVGTRFGIGVDPHDGLLRQGAPGFQLTWMDAKVGDWVVTPRRGKAVEINALWYNALCLLADWLRNTDRADEGAWLEAAAARVRDVVQSSFLARARAAPVRHRRRRERRRRGLPAEPDPRDLAGPPRSRAALLATRARGRPQRAAHTVRPADAEPEAPRLPAEVLRRPTKPRRRLPPGHRMAVAARPVHRCVAASVPAGSRVARQRFLAAFDHHLDDGCVGTISEIFDAESPYAARGCVAQAWSVAEVLRCAVYAARDRDAREALSIEREQKPFVGAQRDLIAQRARPRDPGSSTAARAPAHRRPTRNASARG